MGEDPVVVRHEDRGIVGAAQLLHRLRHGFHRVDIEAGVGLVEDRKLGLEHRQLEDFVALLLAAREAVVDGAIQVAVVPADQLEFFLERVHEFHGAELFLTAVLADRVHGGAEKYALVMPRIATGYWNARNSPSRARSSGFSASRSLPSYRIDPAVTV